MLANASSAAAQDSVLASSKRTSCSAAWVGLAPRFMRTRHRRCGERYAPTSSRHNGDTIHLLDGGLTTAHQIERRGTNQPHSGLSRQLLQLPDRHAADDRLAYLVVQYHQLPDGLAAVIAGAATVPATPPLAELVRGAGNDRNMRFLEQLARGHVGLGALLAHDAHQALRQHRRQRRHETVRIDAHMHEAADHIEDVVGMHRGEHQVPGERRLDGDLRRLRIADLAHHDLVRVVPQNRAQPACEGEALLLVHGYLQHPRQLVLDRVFDRDDLVASGLSLGERRVQGGGLATAGGTCAQQHAGGPGGGAAQLFDDVPLETQHIQPQAAHLGERLLVEDAQHRVFAEDAGNDRHAEVNRAAVYGDLESAVLGDTPLGNVQLRHYLDTRNDLLGELATAYGRNAREHAIQAIAHHQPARDRLEVNVAGAGAQ